MPLSAFTLLLVEDDSNDVLLMKRAFEKAKIASALRIVRNGEEAINYLEGKGDHSDRSRSPLPSLILLDLNLPLKSGHEVLDWVKRHPRLRSIPVIVLTSSKQNDDMQRAYQSGANSYIIKPVGLANLAEMVQTLRAFWMKVNQGPGDLRR